MNIWIRELEAEQWKEFSTIRLEALKNNPSSFLSTYDKEVGQTEEQWRGWLSSDKGCVFGLFDGKHLIGITAVMTSCDYTDGKTGVVYTVYLKPEYRGLGLSRTLYDACINWSMRKSSWQKLVISHREDNPVSGYAIRQHAFIYTHNVAKTWASDGVTCDEVNYEMNLEALRKKQ